MNAIVDEPKSFDHIVKEVMTEFKPRAENVEYSTFKGKPTYITKEDLSAAFNCLLNDISKNSNLSIKDKSSSEKVWSGPAFGMERELFDVSHAGTFSTLGSSCKFVGSISKKDLDNAITNIEEQYKGMQSISLMLEALKNYSPSVSKSNVQAGGKKQTKERIVVNGKNRVIYIGKRGGKYIKQNGEFVSVKKIR